MVKAVIETPSLIDAADTARSRHATYGMLQCWQTGDATPQLARGEVGHPARPQDETIC